MTTLVNPFMSYPAAGGGGAAFPDTDLWVRYEANLETGYSDGDPLATIVDQGPRGFDLTQATPSMRPTYKTGIVNGQPVFRFDGGDVVVYNPGSEVYFPDPAILGTSSPNITIAAVASSGAAEATARQWLFGLNLVAARILFLDEGATSSEWNVFCRTSGGTDQPTTSGVDTRTWTALLFTFNGTNWAFYRDGSLVASGSRSGTFNWGSMSMGDMPAASGYFTGDIALGAIWQTPLDSTARGEFFDYASDTYGTP